MTSVFLMLAIITSNPISKQQEADALAFKTKEKCEQARPIIEKEVLKHAAKIETACVERELY